jgi:hypothetical protein
MKSSILEKGIDWELDVSDAQPWADYLLPDGRLLHLPADAWSRRKYAKKGWRLQPKSESKNLKGG